MGGGGCGAASREEYERAFKEPLTGNATGYVLDALAVRSRLYHLVQEAVQQEVDAVDKALSSGTIEPLRLEFDSGSLVYPLYVTSLGGGSTDVQLYVLSEHRMKAASARAAGYEEEFRTAFAGRLDEAALR